jgi:hypothetical protein
MRISFNKHFKTALATAALALGVMASPAFSQGKIIVVNGNLPGVGFNDVTPAAPIGGNTGTTLGQQRMNVFLHAADIWTSVLNPRVDIYVWARFVPLGTNVLGSAGPISVEGGFDGAEYPDLWYHEALANHLQGFDSTPHDPTFLPNAADQANPSDEISARFATGFNFYFGLDDNEESVPGTVDLLAVVLHEMGHGLGFSNLIDETTGSQLLGFGDVYSQYTIDDSTQKIWNSMTDAERAASALNIRKVSWTGLHVKQETPNVLQPGEPALLGNSTGFSGAFLFGPASFGPQLSATGVTGDVVLANDGTGATSDACEPLTNNVAGKIALVDRGTCTFTVKVKNAQDAGAIAVIAADNVAGSPPPGLGGADATITIPSGRITLADGNALKAALGGGVVNVTMKVDNSILAGTDRINHLALLATFDPVAPGSSILALRRHRVPEPAHGAGDQQRPHVLGDSAGRPDQFVVHRHRLVRGLRRCAGRQGLMHRVRPASHGVLRTLQLRAPATTSWRMAARWPTATVSAMACARAPTPRASRRRPTTSARRS